MLPIHPRATEPRKRKSRQGLPDRGNKGVGPAGPAAKSAGPGGPTRAQVQGLKEEGTSGAVDPVGFREKAGEAALTACVASAA
jgi:hypothetical protein